VGVRIVTDSACDLSEDIAQALHIEVVPLTIRFGTEEFVDREELDNATFWKKLKESETLPETAAPSAGAFETRFRKLIDRGASGIICINLSSKLSGTMQAAQVAASAVSNDCVVQVIDSATCSMGLGSLCLTAARRASDGDPIESIVQEILAVATGLGYSARSTPLSTLKRVAESVTPKHCLARYWRLNR